MERVAVRRAQVRYAMTRRLSCRRACVLLHVARSALGYAARRPARVKFRPKGATRFRLIGDHFPSVSASRGLWSASFR